MSSVQDESEEEEGVMDLEGPAASDGSSDDDSEDDASDVSDLPEVRSLFFRPALSINQAAAPVVQMHK